MFSFLFPLICCELLFSPSLLFIFLSIRIVFFSNIQSFRLAPWRALTMAKFNLSISHSLQTLGKTFPSILSTSINLTSSRSLKVVTRSKASAFYHVILASDFAICSRGSCKGRDMTIALELWPFSFQLILMQWEPGEIIYSLKKMVEWSWKMS